MGRNPALSVAVAHLHQEVIPPSQLRGDMPQDLEQIVLRCLAKDPAERYPNAESVEHALAA